MSAAVEKTPRVPVVIRMVATERDRLRAIVEKAGYFSLSLWFRQQAWRKLQEQEAAPDDDRPTAA
jgi:hypothetical protein